MEGPGPVEPTTPTLSDATIARIRTAVAAGVSTVLVVVAAWAGRRFGLELDVADLGPLTEAFAAAVVGLVAALYTAAVNALARRWRWAGYLLGVPGVPTYRRPG